MEHNWGQMKVNTFDASKADCVGGTPEAAK